MRTYERSTAKTTIPLLMDTEDARSELERINRNVATARADLLDIALSYIKETVDSKRIEEDLEPLRVERCPLIPSNPYDYLSLDALELLLEAVRTGDTTGDMIALNLAGRFDLYVGHPRHEETDDEELQGDAGRQIRLSATRRA